MATIRDKLIEKMNMENIRKMVLEGHSGTSIASYYGVSRNMFSNCFRIKFGMGFSSFRNNITAEVTDEKCMKVLCDKYRRKAVENRSKLYPNLSPKKNEPTYYGKLCGQMFKNWGITQYEWSNGNGQE